MEEAIDQIAILQQYWGYDNQTMVSALRELYYPTILDPFIRGASAVDSSILSVDKPNVSIEQRSTAALSLTLLQLSRQRPGYVEPVLPVTRNGQEVGLDHVIAGIDAIFHLTEIADNDTVREGLRVFGIDRINSLYAVTWQGDLGAAGQQAYNKAANEWPFAKFPDIAACRDQSDSVAAGYCVEMPPEDREGDVMAGVIAAAKDDLDLTGANNTTLAQVLATAYDPERGYYPQRYTRFVDSLGLTHDPATGTIDPTSRQQFIDDNVPAVQAFSQGIIAGQWRHSGVQLQMGVFAPFLCSAASGDVPGRA